MCLPRVEGSELRLHRLTPEIMRKAVFGAFAAEQILSASALAVEQASLASGLIAEPAASGTGSSTKQPASATGSTEKQPASATGSAEKQPANGTGSSTKQPARATGSAARQPSGLPQTSSTAATLWAGLELSPMGMPEPLASLPLVPPQALDLIFVPGSAFCLRSGHRLGYGKGFYDRLLAQAPQALKVGLGFDVQLFDMPDFPADAHDIALDVLVSESGIHDLRRGTSPVNP